MSKNYRNNDKRNANRSYNGKTGKKGYNKGASKDTCSKAVDSFPESNHFPWYTKNPDVLKSAANIPFNRIPGIPIIYDSFGFNEKIEAAMSISVQPCFVLNEGERSYLNDIANDQYAFVRHANSGHSNYEATDLLIAQLAMTQPYSFYAWMCRLYGLLDYYTPNNRNFPDVFGAALHVDIDSLQRDKARFYSYIAIYAKRLQQFYVPKLDVYSKMAYIYANVYTDRADERSQIYLPTTTVWMKYSPRTSKTGGELVNKIFIHANSLMTLDDIAAIGDELLDALVTDEDIGIISGDVLKAYGATGCIAPAVIPQEYRTRPIYDPVFLNLIENARIWPSFTSGVNVAKVSQVISEDGSSLKAEWSTTRTQTGATSRDLAIAEFASTLVPLNCHSMLPTEEDIVEATRFMYSAELTSASGNYTYRITSSDLFLVNSFTIYTRNSDGTYSSKTFSDPYLLSDAEMRDFSTFTDAFTVKPRMIYANYSVDTETFENKHYIMEWDNYTPLDNADMIGINRACMLSEFDFPHRGG